MVFILCLNAVVGLASFLWVVAGPFGLLVIPAIFGVGFVMYGLPAGMSAAPTVLVVDHAVEGDEEVWHFGGLDVRLSPRELSIPGSFQTQRFSVHDIQNVVYVDGKLWLQQLDDELVLLGPVEASQDSADEAATQLADAVARRRRGDAADRDAMRSALDEVKP